MVYFFENKANCYPFTESLDTSISFLVSKAGKNKGHLKPLLSELDVTKIPNKAFGDKRLLLYFMFLKTQTLNNK